MPRQSCQIYAFLPHVVFVVFVQHLEDLAFIGIEVASSGYPTWLHLTGSNILCFEILDACRTISKKPRDLFDPLYELSADIRSGLAP